MNKEDFIRNKTEEWANDYRWLDIQRDYSPEQVWKLQGSVQLEYSLARMGAEKIWKYLHEDKYINALGALTGNQALQMATAGLKAIYVSGWQVAADMNEAGEMYPDQSLYPADSAPKLVRRINNAFMRADQLNHMEEKNHVDWFVPIVADGEAGFGGTLNVFEFTKAMIRAGVAAVHFEDQLSAHKKCGHLGGKVLTSTSSFVQTLTAARLAADVYNVPTLIIARTDANSANLLMSDADPVDADFISDKRSHEGFFYYNGGLDASISRGLSFAPYADLLWFETSSPNLDEARIFSEAILKKYPEQKLAYNCSPSFNWSKHMTSDEAARFQNDLGDLGYKFQFITLAGFHQLNHGMFTLAKAYKAKGMGAYMDLQNAEFASAADGYEAIKHQRFVGTSYFDEVSLTISGGKSATIALEDSTEAKQFN